ncbi:MAG: LytTR family DNA-binding domain-containing protein [Psychrosphaera sp.]|nr:LytTR family DNA-binding domain-containing protein [Psychrosphaera sp.]
MISPISVLIVDDEVLGRQRVSQLLQGVDDFTIAGECDSGVSALKWLNDNSVDVVFLDIQMPQIDGFELIRLLPAHKRPFVVFDTAYEQYAVEAFKVHALDYLLKPIERGEFGDTLQRIKATFAAKNQTNTVERALQLDAFLDALLVKEAKEAKAAKTANKSYIPIKKGDRVLLISLTDIELVEADRNYLNVHAGQTVYRTRETLKQFAERVGHLSFVQVHRSRMVNVDHIKEVQSWFHGDYMIITHSGLECATGAAYKGAVRGIIDG